MHFSVSQSIRPKFLSCLTRHCTTWNHLSLDLICYQSFVHCNLSTWCSCSSWNILSIFYSTYTLPSGLLTESHISHSSCHVCLLRWQCILDNLLFPSYKNGTLYLYSLIPLKSCFASILHICCSTQTNREKLHKSSNFVL